MFLRSPSDPQLPQAACAGLPPSVVFAQRPQEALPALLACGNCPVRAPCEEIVDPEHSWFDGVCAGRLWRNGRVIAVAPAPGLSA